MRGVARGLAPIRDAYSGGVAYDRQTLDVHRRQLAAMRATRRRAALEAGARRALPHARDAVREGHRPALVAICSPAHARPADRRARWEAGRGATGARAPSTARALRLEHRRRRRRRGPRRRPGAAAAVAPDDDALDVVERRSGPRRGRRPAAQLRRAAAAAPGTDDRRRRDDVEAEVERRAARDADRRSARRTCTGRSSRRARTLRGRALDLEGGREAAAARRAAPTAARTKAASPGRRPSSLRPVSSMRRTSSASNPMPALKANRRPLTRPRPIRAARAAREQPRRCDGIARRGRARAGGRSSRRPGGTRAACRPSTPFRTSLYVPSPERT